jgi:hypothetical protein
MEFRWEQHTRQALREAEALLSPVSVAWIDTALPPVELLDPSAAIERLLSGLLATPRAAEDTTEESLPLPPSVQTGHEGPSLFPPKARASAPKLRTFAHPSLGARPSEFEAPSPSAFADSLATSQPAPTREIETVRTERHQKVERSTPKPVLGSPRLGVTRMVTELPDLQNLFGAMMAQPLASEPNSDSHASRVTNPSDAARSATSLLESGAAGTRSLPLENTESAPSPRAFEDGRTPLVEPSSSGWQPARLNGPSFRRVAPPLEQPTAVDQQRDPEVPTPMDLHLYTPIDASLPIATPGTSPWMHAEESPSRAMNAVEDPLWEERLFDRFMDRWEDRLREQAIRHSGFTGGLT